MPKAVGRIPQAVVGRLKAAAGEKGWIEDAESLAPHLVDWRGRYRGAAPILLRPGSTAEVAAIVRICAETATPIVPQGGNTGMCGGATPSPEGDAVLLSLSRMNRIRALDSLNHTVTAEAGCVLADLQKAAEAADRLFPLSLGAEGSCQIGGNLSTDAGGVAVLKYGTARDLALGLEVVLPSGEVWDGLTGLRKDTAGYDLKHLFIGAEGTLGVITAAVLKLFPLPRARHAAFVGLEDARQAVALLAFMRRATGDAVSAFELIPKSALDLVLKHIPGVKPPLGAHHACFALIETAAGNDDAGAFEAALADALSAGLLEDAALARSESQRRDLWRIRETVPEAERMQGTSVKHDISVPVSAMPDFIDRASEALAKAQPGIRVVAFGHIGDGNVHFNLCPPEGMDAARFMARTEEFNRIVHDLVLEFRGSISAEHGIGQLKRAELRRTASETELALMRTLKAALDPQGIMNPGKLL